MVITSKEISTSASPLLNSVRHREFENSKNVSVVSIIRPDIQKSTIDNNQVTLERHLGLFSSVCFIITMIIGSGIFVAPKGVLNDTQSVGLCLIIWTISGFVALLGALCYAEIGTVIPRNGGEVVYMREGIGSVHERTGDILAYLYVWTTTFIVKPSLISILARTFSQYFLSGIMNCGPPAELVQLLSIFTILILININSYSVSIANRANILFVICKLGTVGTIIIAGLVRIGQGHTENFKNAFAGTTSKPLGIATAFYKGLYAYGGWTSLNSITEELKNPKRNLWLSIVLAVPTVIILFVLTNISYFTAMNRAELLSSDAVAVTWGEVVLGQASIILPILISLSALGSANAGLFASARYCMVGAQYGYLPELFACIQKRRLTPLPGVVLQGFVAIIFCIATDIYSLIDFFSFSAWIFIGLTFVATLCCKFTKRNAFRVIKVPIPIVIFVILVTIYLVVIPVVASPNIGYLIATLIILLGLLFYYPFVYRKIEPKFMKKINQFFQLFFQLERAQVKI